jgi:hypothetical protein
MICSSVLLSCSCTWIAKLICHRLDNLDCYLLSCYFVLSCTWIAKLLICYAPGCIDVHQQMCMMSASCLQFCFCTCLGQRSSGVVISGFRGTRRVSGTRRVRGWVRFFTRNRFRGGFGFYFRVSGAGPRTLDPPRTRPVAIFKWCRAVTVQVHRIDHCCIFQVQKTV